MAFYDVKKLIKGLKKLERDGIELAYSDDLQKIIDSALYEPEVESRDNHDQA